MTEQTPNVAVQPTEGQQTQTPVATPETPTNDRPAWLPEKFQSPEAMAEAYKALEAKLGGAKQPEPRTQAPKAEPPMAPPTDPKVAENVVKESGLDYGALSQEFATKGELTPESYAKLEATGIPRSMVDAFIEGQVAIADSIRTQVFDAVGGEQQFSAMTEWARANWSKAEIEAFNATVDGGSVEQIKLAVRALHNSYVAQNGSAPSYVNTGGNTQATSDVFRSTAELITAMSDPRYQNDEAYRRDVEMKLARSNVM